MQVECFLCRSYRASFCVYSSGGENKGIYLQVETKNGFFDLGHSFFVLFIGFWVQDVLQCLFPHVLKLLNQKLLKGMGFLECKRHLYCFLETELWSLSLNSAACLLICIKETLFIWY
jgi:hypothetical protein